MKPKLLLFSHLCNKTYITGAEKLLLFLTRELQAYYDCVLVVPEEGQLSAQASAYQIPFIVQPCLLFYSMVLPSANLHAELEHVRQHSEWDAVVRLLADLRPDIVLTNTAVHALPALAAKSLGIPVLWQINEAIADNAFTSNAVSLIRMFSDGIIGVSETTLALFRRYVAEPHVPVYVLPPSWHMDSLEPERWSELRARKRYELNLSPAHRLIGYISSAIYANKGLEHFLHMALQVSERVKDARFVVVGAPADETYFKTCKDKVKSAPANRFHFIHFVSSIQSIYPAMDIVVIPSLAPEGFGLTALEGLVFGKPVVAYGSGGLAEIMRATGNEESMAEPGNVNQLTQKVLDLALHRDKAEALGRRNREAAEREFGAGTYRDRLAHILVHHVIHNPAIYRLIQGSQPIVYLEDHGAYRPIPAAHRFKYADPAHVRRLPDAVLAALPKGAAVEMPGTAPPAPVAGTRKERPRRRRRKRRARTVRRSRRELRRLRISPKRRIRAIRRSGNRRVRQGRKRVQRRKRP
ncbi:glycosyltransferase family 4 protein [Paenibacillus profundus]|uniref:Glycosyltransferase family 4 protein n=1 Tax=Paenibacillus profundus TaxID=1173085 RepID=A0ABS8YKV1_9BACL|nr:glycosyltransferase family 4 protein [Paenibacillus profundus]MCE5170169.1 glycosyltransferase family 4 protein [Paenibacillus profundus]